MRLINAKTLELGEFFGDSIPSYAILSHTWGLQKDEVSLQDWQFRKEEAFEKPGFFKINAICEEALLNNLGYAWIDTMCIDKTSSSELSEAINSMFVWYRNAVVCYVYLSDVSKSDEHIFPQEQFYASRWFTRGWTLQELLAPSTIIFYSCEWIRLGTKSDLDTSITSITGIDSDYLLSPNNLKHASVSEKMYWASARTTTRAEDIAYCLLGIFDITMPLLYGEGDRAFVRLQEEIIKVSPDHTIFCWSWIHKHVPSDWGSVLAPCPSVFKFSKDFQPISHSSPHSMTNIGLSIEVRVINGWRCHLVVLRAKIYQDNGRTNACIPVTLSSGESSYARIRGPTIQPLSIPVYWIPRFPRKNIIIQSKMSSSLETLINVFGEGLSQNTRYNSQNGCYMVFGFNKGSFQIPTELETEVDAALIQVPKSHQNSSFSRTLTTTRALAETDGPDNTLSFLIAFKTSAGKFCMIRPTFRIKVWDKLDTRVIGGLMRVTCDDLNCVIFIGKKASLRVEFGNRISTVWYCGVFPHYSWGENRKTRAALLKTILDGIATEGWGYSWSGSELRNEISTVHLLAISRSLPSLTLGDWALRKKNVKYSLALQKPLKFETYRLHTS
ncbi:hypothetical protein OCU04_006507 [Sclerotinia nivalis]|uniref:Heterokaryon incompatibility domain-containing protein n=1 Tax=Sclerotinia nivalis TaxID=352851 RepID=A0A9X0AJV7_9HELO|nr:hypothetical protein OCU04_006507 [Sclerotinia nivalis]